MADGASSGAFQKLERNSLDGLSTDGTAAQSLESDGAGGFQWGKRFIAYSQALTPASVAANTTAEETFTVTGLATTDALLSVIKPTAQAGLGIVGIRISATNTLGITFSNNTVVPIVPTAAEAYKIHTWR